MKLTGNHLKGFWTKKKILLVSLVLIFAIGAGVTTAYMWHRDTTKTVNFNEAKVDCQVVPDNDIYYVKNTGTVPCYIRATFSVNWVGTVAANQGQLYYKAPKAGTDYTLTISKSGYWERWADGYWYYVKAVQPGERTEKGLFVITNIKNIPQGYQLKPTVVAEAIQALPEQYDQMSADPAYIDAWKPTQTAIQKEPLKELPFYANVMTFNIRQASDSCGDTNEHSWAQRKNVVIQYLNQKNQDIYCLQEVCKHNQYPDIKNGMNNKYDSVYFERDTSEQSEGLMIIYNTEKFGLVQKDRFWLSETPDTMSKGWGANYYRICVVAVLQEKTTGKIVRVFNTHLDHEVKAARVEGLKLINQRKTNYPEGFTILAGDFNAEATETDWYNQMKDGYGLRNVAPGSQIRTLNKWKGGTFENDMNATSSPIDYIFVDEHGKTSYGDVAVHGAIIDTNTRWKEGDVIGESTDGCHRYLSDHYAVRVELEFKANS